MWSSDFQWRSPSPCCRGAWSNTARRWHRRGSWAIPWKPYSGARTTSSKLTLSPMSSTARYLFSLSSCHKHHHHHQECNAVQWREVTASLHLFAKFANSFVPGKNSSSCSAIVLLLWCIATFKSLLKEMSSVALDCVEVSLWLLSLERKGRKEQGSLKTDCLSCGSVMLSGRRWRFRPRVLAKTRRHDHKSAGVCIDTERSRLRPCRRNCSSHGCCIHCFQITRKSYLRKRASQSRRAGNNPYQWCCCCTSKPYFFFHFPLPFAHLVSSLVSLASFLLPPATHLPFAHLDLLWFPCFLLLPPASHVCSKQKLSGKLWRKSDPWNHVVLEVHVPQLHCLSDGRCIWS